MKKPDIRYQRSALNAYERGGWPALAKLAERRGVSRVSVYQAAMRCSEREAKERRRGSGRHSR